MHAPTMFLLGAWIAAVAPAGAADTLQVYHAPRAGTPPTVDGRPDEDAWRVAPWSDLFVDIVGGDAPPPPLSTRLKLMWDDRHLYVAAEMEEPHLWATLTEHDAIVWKDDDFEVFLDPDGDGLGYFEVEINPLGTVLDLMLDRPYREGGSADLEWDVRGLRSAVHLDGTVNDPSDVDVGWSVEMAIPWTALVEESGVPRGVTPPRPGDSWRVNFSRVDWPLEVVGDGYRKAREATPEEPHPESNWVWSPQGEVNMHVPERWGVVRFVETTGRES